MRLCGYSVDQLLSYETPKIAVINDRRLGLIYYSLVVCVILWVFIDVILIQKRYMLLGTPVGSVRFSLQGPQSQGRLPPPAPSLPYCRQSGNASYNGFPTQTCIYWDEAYVLYPSIEQSAMFIATRVNNNSQSQADGCSISDNTCFFVDDEPPSPLFFIADIENFTVMFDHSFYVQSIGLSGNSRDLDGQLLNHHGKVMKLSPPNQVGQPSGKNATRTAGDVLTVGEILRAAGIKSLDQPSRATPGRSIRDDGVVIMMFIDYSNTFSFNPNNIRYQYRFRAIRDAKFKGVETLVTKNTASRVLVNRHGIRIIIQQTGTLGKFDFEVLILSLVSGMALITMIAVVMDYLIKYCRPLRTIHVYASEKFIETEEWGQRRYETIQEDRS